jgi:hypothetical protein
MWKRMLAVCGLLLFLGLAALVGWHLLPPRPGVTPENFHRLRVGMTEREVEAILGQSTRPMPPLPPSCWDGEHSHIFVVYLWGPFDGYLVVGAQLDTDDSRRESLPNHEPSLLERLRRGLPWEPASQGCGGGSVPARTPSASRTEP